jgi:predicted membrane-bound dolichyl-phosphate-mannose-protein mannosyltransferase
MKSLNLNFQKNKNNFLYSLVLFVAFIVFVLFNKEYLFQTFNPNVVTNYLRSQDIIDTNNIIKDRIFVSDEDIYIASGYLYANGSDPVDYNFQHPPFIKYLFGVSAKYFNLPLLPNIFFAAILISEVYLLGFLVFKNRIVGLLSSLLLIIDPVFKEVTIYALLDLGQMVFMLGFIVTTFFWKKHWIGQGVLLGLAFASKFYSPVIIFLGIIYLYKFVTKELNIKREALMLVVSFLTFCSVYFVSFINNGFLFNIFFHQAKIIKFMLDHNQAVEWGGVIKIFFGGYIFWPIAFFTTIFSLFGTRVKDIKFLFLILPLVYLLVMCFQIPFTRYFVLILPFLYLSFVAYIIQLWKFLLLQKN